jgi:hypothetical protein
MAKQSAAGLRLTQSGKVTRGVEDNVRNDPDVAAMK